MTYLNHPSYHNLYPAQYNKSIAIDWSVTELVTVMIKFSRTIELHKKEKGLIFKNEN